MSDQGPLARAALAARARRRWWLMIALTGAGAAVGVAVVESVFLPGRNRHPGRTHAPSWSTGLVLVVSALVVVAVGVGIVWFATRQAHGDSSAFAPPLAMGRPRSDRRRLARNLRRATPTDDPRLVWIERDLAVRTRRQQRWALPAFGVFAGLELAEAVTRDSAGGRTFFGLATLVFLLFGGYTLRTSRQATKYLAVAAEGDAR